MKEVYLTINMRVKYLEINSLYLIYNSVKVKTILTTKTVKSFYIYLSLNNKRDFACKIFFVNMAKY